MISWAVLTFNFLFVSVELSAMWWQQMLVFKKPVETISSYQLQCFVDIREIFYHTLYLFIYFPYILNDVLNRDCLEEDVIVGLRRTIGSLCSYGLIVLFFYKRKQISQRTISSVNCPFYWKNVILESLSGFSWKEP